MHALPKALERTQTTFALAPIGEVTALERQWRALDRIGSHSFFTSWPWVAATLALAPRPLALITASRNGALAGLALARLSVADDIRCLRTGRKAREHRQRCDHDMFADEFIHSM